mgnify:CR=1 FL=1
MIRESILLCSSAHRMVVGNVAALELDRNNNDSDSDNCSYYIDTDEIPGFL